MRPLGLGAAGIAAVLGGATSAQGTLADGNARFTLGAFPPLGVAAPQPASFSASSCIADVLHEVRWLWRLAGDADATPFSDAGHGGFAQQWSGSSAVLTFTDVGARGLFDAVLSIEVRETGVDIGTLTSVLTVTNRTATPLPLDVFFYADVDHNGAIGDDRTRAGSSGDRWLVVDDEPCGACTEVFGDAPSRWEVGAFPTLILNLLRGGNAYDLRDRGLPFGPGDFTGSMQWCWTVAPGSASSATAVVGHGDLHVGGPGIASNSGTSTAGAGGAPTCTAAGGLPVYGAPYALALTEPTGVAPGGAVMIGVAPQMPVALCGITLHIVAPIATLPVAFTSGIGTFVYPGFCDPAWLGVELATQLFSIDPTGPCATIPLVASDLHVHRYGD